MITSHKALPWLTGAWIAFFGVLVISPDTLLLRLIQADAVSTVFWRSSLVALTMALLLVGEWRWRQGTWQFVQAWRPTQEECLTAFFFSISATFFVLSVKHTSVANTLVIVAATPLISSIISLLVFRRNQALRTWVASGVVFMAIAMIVGDGWNNISNRGDLFAVVATVAMASYFNLFGRFPAMNAMRTMMLGSLGSALGILPFVSVFALTGLDSWWLFLCSCVVIPISFTLISIGAKTIPAAEVGLIMLIEMIVGTFIVWWLLGEVPTQTTIIAGGVVLITLVVHGLLSMRGDGR